MTDIVRRLRESAAPLSDPDLNDEAADELERFQTSLVRLKMQLDQQREYHAAELADVMAERDHAVEQAAKNADKVLRLREQVAGLREDAERYKYLRDVAWETGSLIFYAERYGPEDWDAHIDAELSRVAARKATQ